MDNQYEGKIFLFKRKNISMEIIPVIDIMNGKAVHAIRGERNNYKPLKSIYSDISDPVEIAENLPYKRIYVADLDAIMGDNSNFKIIEEISEYKRVILDSGIKHSNELNLYRDLSINPVIGTETLESMENLKENLQISEEVFMSIDIKDDRVISPFLDLTPLKCFELFYGKGIENFIFLEISSVGTMSLPSFDYLDKINKKVKVLVGGGITKKDIKKLKERNVFGVLMGTALYNELV
ncbi:MAG TPA: HisA/HisF family protein [Euryarchaeota archaeon]|nr:HisA/HisF family protein [Euryarchaeota archaeon]